MKKHAKKLIVLLLAVAMIIPTIAMLYSSAAGATYPVELAFNNLFIFEEWASDENSTTPVYGGDKNVGKLTTNIENGSFTIEKTSTTVPQVYNGHGESKTDSVSNTDYYSITVEPNTTYRFSYNLDRNTSDAVLPYLFLFDSGFLCKVIYEAPSASIGANSFLFTTPPDVTYIQFRFTLNKAGTAEATFSNISVTKQDVVLDSTNLFNFDLWESSSNNALGIDGSEIDCNPNTDTIDFTIPANLSGFTSFNLDENTGYYNIPVSPNATYVLNYNLISTKGIDFSNFTPYVVRSDSNGKVNGDYAGCIGASGYGKNSCVFTTNSNTAYVTIVFQMGNDTSTPWEFRIANIELLKAVEVTGPAAVTPGRVVKTYGEDATYGTLPTPSDIPEDYVFAGWYTGENGSGMRIAADTAVQPQSFTVYPKFELAVDSLTVKTQPARTVYTVGEKLDTTGLVLEATDTETVITESDTNNNGTIEDNERTEETITSTFEIASGYYCTPEVLNTAGTQPITAYYGGKTATFNVTVRESNPGTVIVNGVSTDVAIANNEYIFNLTTTINRYEVTYKSDSYVSGIATFNGGKTEEFFLEPSGNGSFGSYVDNFFGGNSYNQLVKIKFTTLDKDNGQFELYSLKTDNVNIPKETLYFDNGKYEMGISLKFGGVVSELYDLKKDVYARTYSNGSHDITLVDYKDKLDSGHKAESQKVNLINTLDRGRYLQQSYYGTGDKPYIQSEYNNAAWPYNPVQGGNVIGEASKIIDYRVTNDYVYVKARPLDWAKWSDEYAATDSRYEAIWGDDYITDTYVEAWYYFQDNTIKVTNRKVDYSGLPEASHSQEFPALYLIEPLNHFVYNNVSTQDAWKTEAKDLYKNSQFIDYTDATRKTHWSKTHNEGVLINYEEPEYWGLTQMYKDKFGMKDFEPWVTVNENWAAFTASEDADSFGVGLYTDTTTKFYYGVQPTMYQQKAGSTEGSVGEVLDTPEYRHAQTVNPAPELPTSYIAPTDTAIFRSYEPTEFTYYLATGTASEIREEFRGISKASEERAKPKIAVPETVYLNPSNNRDGQYYANNVMNVNNYYNIEPTIESDYMYLGIHVDSKYKHFSVKVTNETDSSNDIFVGNLVNDNGTTKYDEAVFGLDGTTGTVVFDYALLGLHLSKAIQPGQKVTAKWEVTVYTANPNDTSNYTSETYTAYTVMYAPHRTVGAVAEARQVNASQHELSSWITGANGVDHSTRAPLGSFKGDYRNSGYFRQDPLVYTSAPKDNVSGGTAYDYILGYGTPNGSSDDYHENAYVMQTATNDHDSSRSQSYLGLLAIDKSRYTNTDQIPNLRIGYDALRVGSYANNSLGKYNTYYTVGDELAYTATSLSEAPGNGWTKYSSHTDMAGDGKKTLPYRESFVPSYKVADLDGKYLHAIAQGEADQTVNSNQYATAGTSVLISLTDKSALRDSVLDGYGVTDPSEEFLEKLEEAATILGDPGASQEDIDRVMDDIDEYLEIFYALKYDNIFSAYEMSLHENSMKMSQPQGTATYKDGTITTTNTELGYTKNDKGEEVPITETYTIYSSGSGHYLVDLEPNTNYVFEYDVTTTAKSQAFMFFYTESGSGSEPPTNIKVQTNGGSWTSRTEGNAWWGNYQGSAGSAHYVIKFTTGATTEKAAFRFGNTVHEECTSTFSNIRLVEATHYFEDVQYTMTEEVYKEHAYYSNLQVPVRNGYNFNGWFDANGYQVSSINTATEHKSVYSDWSVINYKITYDANGGSVNPTSKNYTVEDTLNIPVPTRGGYIFQGWLVTAAEGNWELNGICVTGEVPARMYGNVTLTAQWTLSNIPVYFDTILDFDKWNTNNQSNASVSKTDNSITVTSNTGAGEGYTTSPFFPVTPDKEYRIDIDITGNGWDVYIFFYDDNTSSGNGIGFKDDATNRYSSNGTGDPVFTAPAGATRAVIRLDANGSNNTVTFSDIRVYEAGTRPANVNVPDSSKEVQYGGSFGTLPVPTKEGYTFKGWYDTNGYKVTDNADVTYTSAVYLTSKWVINDTALVSDTVVVDFATPIDITPLANDTVYNSAEGTKTFLGFSSDGTNHGATTINGNYGTFAVNGETVTYTPSKAVNGAEKIYYHASVEADGKKTEIKSEITVAPASNVLYEENLFAQTLDGLNWTRGTATTVNQSSSTEKDVYGYDSNTNGYNRISNYSNGSAYTVTVDNNSKRSKNMTFDFAGEGFDLISACGPNTGVLVVTLRDNSTNKIVKSYLVDTYYGDTNYATSTNNTLYQVPVINETGREHSDYTVQIIASYLPSMSGACNSQVSTQSVDGMTVSTASGAGNAELREALAEIGLDYVLDAEEVEVVWFDEDSVLNGGDGANTVEEGTVSTQGVTSLLNVIDSVRVYKPIENGDEYYIPSEKNAQYYNVMDNLVNGKEDGIIPGLTNGFFAYVSGNNNASITIDNYNSIGPKDELYLAKNDEAIAFTINGFDKTTTRVMISLRAASGTPTVKIGENEFEVKSNTEMYYDITDYIENRTVTVQNKTSGTLLSVGSIKVTSTVDTFSFATTELDLATASFMMSAPSTTVEPNTPNTEPEAPADPVEPENPVNPEEPSDDNSSECWLVRFINWVIEMFKQVINVIKNVLGF